MATMCRVCLSEDVRMYATGQTRYAEIYEKHTGATLISGQGIPDMVCYLCNYLLLKFNRFLSMSQKAEKYFQDLHHSRIVILQENLTVVDQELHSLSMTTTQCTSIADDVHSHDVAGTSSALGFFKNEDNDVSVKIESVDYEEDHISENMDTEDVPQPEMHPDDMFRGFPSEVESSDDITIVENESNQVEPPTVNQNESIQVEPSTKNQNESNQVKSSTNNLAGCLNKYASVILERISIESISQHKSVDSRHYCTKCDYKCLLKSVLKKHMKVHNQSPTYSCKICSYRFRTIQHLNNHERIHKKYHGECKVCGKTYAKPLYLQRHMKIHIGQKQYECKMCVRKFNHKSTFLVHMRTHTGEKPFSCTFCGKKFNDKSNCRKHTKTHIDQQLYECYMCCQTFSQKSHLIDHVIIHIL